MSCIFYLDSIIFIIRYSNYYQLYGLQEKFEDTKGVIRSRKSKKYRQHDGHFIPKSWNPKYMHYDTCVHSIEARTEITKLPKSTTKPNLIYLCHKEIILNYS